MSCFGIDVSKWQTSLPNLSTVDFLIARASIGTMTDERYAQHIAKAKTAGIVTGAYHFNWDTISVAAQVTTFIDVAGTVDLYALDVEGANAFSVAQATEFIRLMHAAGLECGLYHSASGFFDAGQDWDWIADYRSGQNHSTPGTFWQYTSGGSMAGYAGRLDFDRFNGTLAELHALAGRQGTMGTKCEQVAPMAGKAKMDADGPVWRVVDDVQVDVNAGTDWIVVGSCVYHVTAADPGGSAGWLIVANAADHELHVVAKARVTFTPAPVPAPLPPDALACKPFSDAAVKADRTKAYVAYKP